MNLGESQIGVMFNTDRLSGDELRKFGRQIESIGIDTLWVPELFGREPFVAAGHILSSTTTLRVGTGIANIYARDATAAAAGALTLSELHSGRFVLGLGVSNSGLVQARGHDWEPPVTKLREYVKAVRGIKLSIPGDHELEVHVAAHGPKMLASLVGLVDGVSTFLQTPAHTEKTASQVGSGVALNVTQMCLLVDDPDEARKLARKALSFYVGLNYYHRAWRNLGFTDADFMDGGSDALIDGLVAWGDSERIISRLHEHREAGATEIVVIPLNPMGGARAHMPLLEALTK